MNRTARNTTPPGPSVCLRPRSAAETPAPCQPSSWPSNPRLSSSCVPEPPTPIGYRPLDGRQMRNGGNDVRLSPPRGASRFALAVHRGWLPSGKDVSAAETLPGRAKLRSRQNPTFFLVDTRFWLWHIQAYPLCREIRSGVCAPWIPPNARHMLLSWVNNPAQTRFRPLSKPSSPRAGIPAPLPYLCVLAPACQHTQASSCRSVRAVTAATYRWPVMT